MSLAVEGGDQLAAVGRDLARAGGRLRYRLRRNIVVATAPITSEARAGYSGYGSLGEALAAATTTSVRTAGASVGVSVKVNASRLPEDKQGLPPLVEGIDPWKHPLFGNRSHWYAQDARPELTPAVDRHLPAVQIGVIRAVEETAQALAFGSS